MAAERRTYLVWGAGGHALVVGEIARLTGGDVLGYVAMESGRVGRPVDEQGAEVLLADAELRAYVADHGGYPKQATSVALGIGDNRARRAAHDTLPGLSVPALVHPHATVSSLSTLGSGTVVMAGAVVNPHAVIGAAVIVNTASVVEHDCLIEDAAHVAPGAVLSGGVHVGEMTLIGANSVVLPGVRVGSGSVVGAGAVVLADVPDGATVVGSPARARE
jgi:sugar O-acyltransferase (sialic acid O-acetyltransferase NeuD family)